MRLIVDGDVSASLLAVSDRSPVTLLWGIGGTPEGVISAAAIKAIGGGLVGRLWPRDDDERKAALDGGYDLDTPAHPGRPRPRRRLLLLRDRRDRRRRAAGRALPRHDRLDGVDRHALAHRAPSAACSARHNRAKLREVTGERYG